MNIKWLPSPTDGMLGDFVKCYAEITSYDASFFKNDKTPKKDQVMYAIISTEDNMSHKLSVAFGAKDDGLYEYWKESLGKDLDSAKLDFERILSTKLSKKYLFNLGFLNDWNSQESC
jgi:hypothetical protein